MAIRESTEVKPLFQARSANELLASTVSVLRGIETADEPSLATCSISTVFDLALSPIFRRAQEAAAVANAAVLDAPCAEPAPVAAALAALGLPTPRHLVSWPPYLVARRIINAALLPEEPPNLENTPSELDPSVGEFPTDVCSYQTLVLEEAPTSATAKKLEDGPIDVEAELRNKTGFTKPVKGVLLTYEQSWYTHDLTLGHLLHSTALAPGESTRLAMVDWSRRSSASQSENITEGETLSNDVTHARALNEVTDAVATEAQKGFSGANVTAAAYQEGTAHGGIDLNGGIGIGGESTGYGTNASQSFGYSFSTGSRDVHAETQQDIAEKTHQYATAVRNRRATVVKEVSQQESETLTTRILANYNHMHALSVHYYEVLQLYRVVLQLVRVEPVLLVPLKVPEYKAPAGTTTSPLGFDPDLFKNWLNGLGTLGRANIVLRPTRNPTNATDPKALWRATHAFDPTLSADARLSAIAVKGGKAGDSVILTLRDGTTEVAPVFGERATLSRDLRMADVAAVDFDRKSALDGTSTSPLAVTLDVAGAKEVSAFTFEVASALLGKSPIASLSAVPERPQPLIYFLPPERQQLLFRWTQWRNLSPTEVSIILASYTYGGKPLLEQVDPTPLGMVGNCLVLKSTATLDARSKWTDQLKASAQKPLQHFVPLPTGGVHAEAVLGKSNSAEKIDLTRFWNWQDSPIPLTPPEISPLVAASRAEPENVTPGQLGPPLVNIVNPPAFPDPQGLTAVLSAIQNGNMFRDMSGLSSIVGLATKGAELASAGATSAASQAGLNMQTAAQFITEIAKIMASAFGMGGGGSADNITGQGGKQNEAKKLEKETPKKQEPLPALPPGTQWANYGTEPEAESSGDGTTAALWSTPQGLAFLDSLGVGTLVAANSSLAGVTGGTGTAKTPSGVSWVVLFPADDNLTALDAAFRQNVENFIVAVTAAGGKVQVNSVYRPPERQYLMYWSWHIVHGTDAQLVPPMAGVNIEWWHGSEAASKKAAQDMVDGYGMTSLATSPAQVSRHTQRRAVDMDISWTGNLTIAKPDGTTVKITSSPKSGANSDLIAVGKDYGVIHFTNVSADVPHWSTDGK